MELVILIGSIVISFLVFTWLLKVVKATLKTALLVAVILLALQLIFGIGPATLWEYVQIALPDSQ
jgi:type IV secretory pathway TrbL component